MYKIDKQKIIIENKNDFIAKHILECGQIFRYELQNNDYVVYSLDKKAKIIENENCYIIETKDINYFIDFFDLATDYGKIKRDLFKFNNEFLNKAINFL